MELLVAVAAFVIVDVLAIRFGADSRPNTASPNDTVPVRNS
jgi:hypothetical protein